MSLLAQDMHAWNHKRFILPQKRGFSSLISPQSLSPSHKKERGIQIVEFIHFTYPGWHVRSAGKRQPDKQFGTYSSHVHHICPCEPIYCTIKPAEEKLSERHNS